MIRSNGALKKVYRRDTESKHWIRSIYKKMIEEYSSYEEGDKTNFEATVTPLFIETLKKRYNQICVNSIWYKIA